MAVRRECTKIGHVVPWTVGASLITLSGPRASPLVVSARLFGCHSAHGRRAQTFFTSRRDKFVNAPRHVNRTNGLHLAGTLLYRAFTSISATSTGARSCSAADGRLIMEGERGRGVGTLMRNQAGDLVMNIDATLSDNSTLSAQL